MVHTQSSYSRMARLVMMVKFFPINFIYDRLYLPGSNTRRKCRRIWWCFFIFLSLHIFICYCWEFDRWRQKKKFFFSSFARVKMRTKRIEWCSVNIVHASTHRFKIYVYLFSVSILMLFVSLLAGGIFLLMRDEALKALGFFPSHLIIAKKWIGYFACEFICCWKKHSYIIIICLPAMVFCFVHFSFTLPFCCSFIFCFVSFLFHYAFFILHFVKQTNPLNYDGYFQMTKIYFIECRV